MKLSINYILFDQRCNYVFHTCDFIDLNYTFFTDDTSDTDTVIEIYDTISWVQTDTVLLIIDNNKYLIIIILIYYT